MQVSLAIQKRVNAKLAKGIKLAEASYKTKFNMPTVRYDVRGTTAGLAFPGRWLVRFNAVLLTENVEDFLGRTVPHELAHLLTDRLYPRAMNTGVTYSGGRFRRRKRSVHGWEWQSVMRTLGISDPTRCHNYDVTNARVKKQRFQVMYRCTRCETVFPVGPKSHRRLQINPKSLWHRSCKGALLVLATTTPVATMTAPKPQQSKVPATGTKMERALALFRANPTEARLNMIEMFVRELGMTNAGASTYYYNCKKAA